MQKSPVLRAVTTATAALALAFGTLSLPAAVAAENTPGVADINPAQLWGKDSLDQIEPALLSEVQEVDINDFLTVENDWLSKNEEGDLVNNPDTGFAWTTYAYNNSEYGADRDYVKTFRASSPAMGRTLANNPIYINVITPDGNFNTPRPTIYLLNGAGGAEQDMDWLTMTGGNKDPQQNVIEFYKQKNVNVAVIQGGAFSYYTDWLESPNQGYLVGPQKWETFLTRELPGPFEKAINADGQRGIAGMSMSATSALLLAEHNPGFYDAVGSYSGCAATSTPLPRFYTYLTVNRGGGTPDQMWGPAGGDYNLYNDAEINATKNNLGGTEIYVSTNSGLPGENEMLSSIMEKQGESSLAALSSASKSSSTLVVEGGAIEAAMNDCTRALKRKMDSEGVDANWVFRPTGTHSWPGWRKDLSESWPTFARAFDQDPNPTASLGLRSAITGDQIVTEAPAAEDERAAVDLNVPPVGDPDPQALAPVLDGIPGTEDTVPEIPAVPEVPAADAPVADAPVANAPVAEAPVPAP